MILKQLIDEDFTNYKMASMLLGFPRCTWKCEEGCGRRVCQNGALAAAPDIDVDVKYLVGRYLANHITTAIVCGGLEPFDSPDDLVEFIDEFRSHCNDDVVIYTGYTEVELFGNDAFISLKKHPNLVVKFGRYQPDKDAVYDEILGVWLANSGQYARRITQGGSC